MRLGYFTMPVHPPARRYVETLKEDREAFETRFFTEARSVNEIRHPNIVEIYDIGALGDRRPYYAMEYLAGRTLSMILEEQGRQRSVVVAAPADSPRTAILAAAPQAESGMFRVPPVMGEAP